MTQYKRNYRRKLISVRLLFIVAISAIILLIKSDLQDYGYVLTLLLVFGSIFPISDLYIDDHIIVVKQYFVYGLIRSKTMFTKDDDISMDKFDIEIANAATWADLETDALTEPFVERKYKLESRDLIGKRKTVKLKLSSKECSLIKKQFIDKALHITGGFLLCWLTNKS